MSSTLYNSTILRLSARQIQVFHSVVRNKITEMRRGVTNTGCTEIIIDNKRIFCLQ